MMRMELRTVQVVLSFCLSGWSLGAQGLANHELEVLVTEKTAEQLKCFLKDEKPCFLYQLGARSYIPVYVAKKELDKLAVLVEWGGASVKAALGDALCIAVSDYFWSSAEDDLQAIRNLLAVGADPNPRWWKAPRDNPFSLRDYIIGLTISDPSEVGLRVSILGLLQAATNQRPLER